MGLPTLAMGLLGLLMPVAQAATLLAAPSLATNVWQALSGGAALQIARRFWPMQLAIAAGTVVPAVLLPSVAESTGRQLLGACLLAYGAIGLIGRPLPRMAARWERPAGVAAGAATGLLAGLTGVFVLPAVPFLQCLGLPRNELAQALGLCFTTSTLALAAVLAAQGHVTLQASVGSVLMVLPAVAGLFVGQLMRQEMSEPVFRRCFFAGLFLLGAWLAVG
jgi:uncharacterized membrane protein YfcA